MAKKTFYGSIKNISKHSFVTLTKDFPFGFGGWRKLPTSVVTNSAFTFFLKMV